MESSKVSYAGTGAKRGNQDRPKRVAICIALRDENAIIPVLFGCRNTGAEKPRTNDSRV